MTEILATGAVFALEDRFSAPLAKLISGLTKADERTKLLQAQLNGLGLGGASAKINAELERMTGGAGAAADKMLGSFAGLERGIFKNFEGISGASGSLFGQMKVGSNEAVDAMLGGMGRFSKGFAGEVDATKAASVGMWSGMTEGASSATATVLGEIGNMRQGVTEQLEILKTNMGGLWSGMVEGAETASSGIVEAMGRAGAAVDGPLASVRALLSETTAATERLAALSATGVGAASAAGATLPGSGRGGRPGSGGEGSESGGGVGRARHGGPHFGRVGTEIPGGHASLGGGPAMAAAGVIGYGVYEAAAMRDEVNRLMITAQVDAEKWGATREQLGKLLMDSASLTGFSVGQVGEALSKSERAMSGLDVQTKMSVTKELTPYAAAEARLKETSLAESLQAMVGLAHMTGVYEPDKIRDLARKFSYVSLSTNSSLPQFERTLSYSMPILRTGMGMNPDTVMALTAVSQNAGITSSKSGTWLRSFFQGSEPEVGDSQHAKKHNAALRSMGLLDGRNMPTWKVTGADGKTDWNASVAKEGGIIQQHMAGVPIDQRMGVVKNIWGERGGAMASMLSMNTFVDQFVTLAGKIQNFQGGADALEQYAKDNPLQKGREAWRDFQNVLIDIGDKTLPGVNAALTSLDVVLKALPADWAATMKMWGASIHAPEDALKKGADALGKAVPGPLGAPFRDTSKPAFDPNALPALGFMPMAYVTGMDEGAKKATEGFNGLGNGSGVLTGRFNDLGTGSGSLDNVFKILEATGLGAARALAEVALRGTGGAIGIGGGGSGFTNAAYTTWDSPGGGSGRALPSTLGSSGDALPGLPHPSAATHAALPGLPRLASAPHAALPGTPNPYTGNAAGAFVAPVGDHLTAGMRQNNLGNLGFFPGERYAGLLGPSNARDVDHSIAKFDTQESGIRAAASLALHKYLSGRHDAWNLIAAKGGWTPGALGPGASVNVSKAMGLSNRDDLHLDDPGHMVKFLHGLAVQEHGPAGRFYTEDRIRSALGRNTTVSAGRPATVSAPPPRKVSPGAPAGTREAMNLPPIHVHVTHLLDGKVLAKSTTKHQVAMARFPTSMGGPNGRAHYTSPGTPITDAG